MRKNCDMVVIPGGMTNFNHLDVSVNKPFEDYLRNENKARLLSENLPLTRSDKIKGETASKFAE
jgi:hypothetical protein